MDSNLVEELKDVVSAARSVTSSEEMRAAFINAYAEIRAAQIRADAQRTYLPLDPKGPVA